MSRDRKMLDGYVRSAVRAGWTRTQGKSHIKLRSPEGRIVVVSLTPGGHRSTMNARADLRRAGLDV